MKFVYARDGRHLGFKQLEIYNILNDRIRTRASPAWSNACRHDLSCSCNMFLDPNTSPTESETKGMSICTCTDVNNAHISEFSKSCIHFSFVF